MKIKSKFKTYEAKILSDHKEIIELIPKDNYFVVFDKKVFALYKQWFPAFDNDRLFLLEAIEENKTIETALTILDRCLKAGLRRNSTMITIGGGIAQDISGLAASMYYRGIKWIYFPTTFLSQSDSCIGGKTAVNWQGYKNIAGSFYPPDAVYILPEFLYTLEDQDYMSGISEIVKLQLIKGKNGWDEIIKALPGLIRKDKKTIEKMTLSALTVKKGYIEKDEFDYGVRNVLNYGHTIGHALETISDYAIPHGQAINIGMIIANILSCTLGLLDGDTEKLLRENLLSKICTVRLKQEYFDTDTIIALIHRDKKKTGKNLSFILLRSGGEFEKKNDILPDTVENALHQFTKSYIKS
jgi:3-dehydroquinate synthase